MFNELHKAFEKNDTDLFTLQKKPGFSRYLLIRSLGPDHLKALIKKKTGTAATSTKSGQLYQELFESGIEAGPIIEFIREQYPAIRKQRKEQEVFLPNIIDGFGEVKCGVRNDNLNDLVKDLVRDKSIETKANLERKVDQLLAGTVRGYILWQYYNQVTNDLIEHIFNDHENVIPTLRKIKYVDFMVKVGAEVVPFDLKITHISDDYFDLYRKGLIKANHGAADDYIVGNKISELEEIKKYYKDVKDDLKLPNLSGLRKQEIVQTLLNLGNEAAKKFVRNLVEKRAAMVKDIENKLHTLEWWNYKYQGERLFKNNNRFFVFLAYKASFEDARPLKGNLEVIKEKVKERLDALSDGKFNTTKYYYSKDPGLAGPYEVNSTSVLVTD